MFRRTVIVPDSDIPEIEVFDSPVNNSKSYSASSNETIARPDPPAPPGPAATVTNRAVML